MISLIYETLLSEINGYKNRIQNKEDNIEGLFYDFIARNNHLCSYFSEKADYYKNLISGNKIRDLHKSIIKTTQILFACVNESEIPDYLLR